MRLRSHNHNRPTRAKPAPTAAMGAAVAAATFFLEVLELLDEEPVDELVDLEVPVDEPDDFEADPLDELVVLLPWLRLFQETVAKLGTALVMGAKELSSLLH